MAARRLALFVDFDGVLHLLLEQPGARRGRVYSSPKLLHASMLAELLGPYLAEIDIAISSTWARTRILDELRELLPEPLREARDLGQPVDTPRHQLITDWLARLRPDQGGHLLAIDDDNRAWPESIREHLIWCHEPLANTSVADELQEKLCAKIKKAT